MQVQVNEVSHRGVDILILAVRELWTAEEKRAGAGVPHPSLANGARERVGHPTRSAAVCKFAGLLARPCV
jgi:hypothetical protein